MAEWEKYVDGDAAGEATDQPAKNPLADDVNPFIPQPERDERLDGKAAMLDTMSRVDRLEAADTARLRMWSSKYGRGGINIDQSPFVTPEAMVTPTVARKAHWGDKAWSGSRFTYDTSTGIMASVSGPQLSGEPQPQMSAAARRMSGIETAEKAIDAYAPSIPSEMARRSALSQSASTSAMDAASGAFDFGNAAPYFNLRGGYDNPLNNKATRDLYGILGSWGLERDQKARAEALKERRADLETSVNDWTTYRDQSFARANALAAEGPKADPDEERERIEHNQFYWGEVTRAERTLKKTKEELDAVKDAELGGKGLDKSRTRAAVDAILNSVVHGTGDTIRWGGIGAGLLAESGTLKTAAEADSIFGSPRFGLDPLTLFDKAHVYGARAMRGAAQWVSGGRGVDNDVTRVGDQIVKRGDEWFPDDPVRRYDFDIKLAHAFGSLAQMYGASVLMKSAFRLGEVGKDAIIALTGATQQGVQSYDEAALSFAKVIEEAKREDGLTPNEEKKAWSFFLGSLAGTSEVIPFVGDWAKGASSRLGYAIGHIGSRVLEEGVQEGGQQWSQNLIARRFYDPSRPWHEDVLENTAIGGIAAGPVSVGSALHGIHNARKIDVDLRAARAQAEKEGDTQRLIEIDAALGKLHEDYGFLQKQPVREAKAKTGKPGTTTDVTPIPSTEPKIEVPPAAVPAPVPNQEQAPKHGLPPEIADHIARTNPELARKYGIEAPLDTVPEAAPVERQTFSLGTEDVARETPMRPAAPEGDLLADTTPQPAAQEPVRRKVVTPDNSMEVETQEQIVELAALKRASGDMQPRDRSRGESQVQARDIAANLDPEQMRAARVSDTGAPIVSGDDTIISGNGRMMALEQVYRDPALAKQAAAYRTSLGDAAAGMKEPVRILRLPRTMPVEALREFADKSNRPRIAMMSATERAVRDAKAAGDDVMGLYQGGDVTAPQNQQFFKAFLGKATNTAERGALSKDGRLTKEGSDRISNAILAAAYGDPELLSRMLESTDDNIRSVTGAMRDAAGAFIRMRQAMAAGEASPAFDITPQVVETARRIADLRDRGIKPAEFLAQQDAFTALDPIVEDLLRAFYNDNLSRMISRQKLTEVLVRYADEAAKHREDGLFEDTTRPSDIIAVARERALAADGDLFGASSVEPGSTIAPDGDTVGRRGADWGSDAAIGSGETGAVAQADDPVAKAVAGLTAALDDGLTLKRGDEAKLAAKLGVDKAMLPQVLERASERGIVVKDQATGRFTRPVTPPRTFGPGQEAEARQAIDGVIAGALESVRPMMAPGQVVVPYDLLSAMPKDVQQHALGETYIDAQFNLGTMTVDVSRTAFQVMARMKNGLGLMRGRLAHEGGHGLIHIGRIAARLNAIMQAQREGRPVPSRSELEEIGERDNIVMPANDLALLAGRARKLAKEKGGNGEPALFFPEEQYHALYSPHVRQYQATTGRQGWSPFMYARRIDEEAAMHLIDAYVAGQRFGRRIDTPIQRFLNILRRIGNALRGLGFRTADDVLRAFTAGEHANNAVEAQNIIRASVAPHEMTVPVERFDEAPMAALSRSFFGGWFRRNKSFVDQARTDADKAVTGRPITVRAFRGQGDAWNQDFASHGGEMVFATNTPEAADVYAETDVALRLSERNSPAAGDVVPKITPVVMTFLNPLVVDANGSEWDNVLFSGKTATTDHIAFAAQESGHDGLIVRNVRDGHKNASNTYVSLARGTTSSPMSGEMLFAISRWTPEGMVQREAAHLMADIKSFEAQQWKAGATAEEIAARMHDRYGIDVAPEDLVAGRVWWKIDEMLGSQGSDYVLPGFTGGLADIMGDPLVAADREQAATDVDARPGRAQVARGIAAAVAPQITAKLTPTEKKRAADLWRKNVPVASIAETLTRERGSYVRLSDVSAALDGAGVFGMAEAPKSKPGRKSAKKESNETEADTSRARTWTPEADNLLLDELRKSPRPSAAEIAATLSERIGGRIGAHAVYVRTNKLRADGLLIEAGETNKAGKPPRGFPWMPEALAMLTDPELAQLTAPELAVLINQRFGGPTLTGTAVRVRRSRMAASSDVLAAISRSQEEMEDWARALEEENERWLREHHETGVPERHGQQDAEGRQISAGGKPSSDATHDVGTADDEQGRGHAGAAGVAGHAGRGGRRFDIGRAGRFGLVAEGRRTINGERQKFFFVYKDGAAVPSDAATDATALRIMRSTNNWLANAHLVERGPGRWEVQSVKVRKSLRGQGMATALYDAIEKSLGITMQPSGTLTDDGYAFWKKRNAESVRFHRKVGDGWLSPRQMIVWKTMASDAAENATSVDEIERMMRFNAQLNDALRKLPPEAMEPDTFASMFAISRPLPPRERANQLEQQLWAQGMAADDIATRIEVETGIKTTAADIISRNRFHSGRQMWEQKLHAAGLLTFAGEKAATADLNALARAKALAKDGASRERIWDETGWFRGVDGKWRWEIDDSGSYADVSGAREDGMGVGSRMPLDNVLSHRALFSAYPDIAGTIFRADASGSTPGVNARGTLVAAPFDMTDDKARSVLLHETQHLSQKQEGFAGGGTDRGIEARVYNSYAARINDALQSGEKQVAAELRAELRSLNLSGDVDTYRRLSGEVEARNVQRRMDMTPEERRANPPWTTEDVPQDQQIVRFGSGPQMMASLETEAERGEKPVPMDRDGRTDARKAIDEGRSVFVDERVVVAHLAAAREHMAAVPDDIRVAAVTSVTPMLNPTRDSDVIVSLRGIDGWSYSIESSAALIIAGRAMFDPQSGTIVLSRFGTTRDVGKSLRGEIYHEAGHALWRRSSFADARAALLAHASSIGVLDVDMGDYLRLIGSIAPDDASFNNITIRETYEYLYREFDGEALQSLLDEEAVSFLIEMAVNNALPAEMADPIRHIIDAFAAGAYTGRSEAASAGEARQMAAVDASIGRSMREDMDKLGYFSGALRAARNLRQAKGTPEQMLAMLGKGGAKKAEIEATGLGQFLDGKASVTKDEIVRFLEENRVGLKEITSGQGAIAEWRDRQLAELEKKYSDFPVDWNGQTIHNGDDLRSAMEAAATRLNEEGYFGPPIRWASYSLDPSNPTYRETVLHLLTQPMPKDTFASRIDYEKFLHEIGWRLDEHGWKAPTEFTSGHFPEPNIVGHMMTSLVHHDGKPVFLIDQIQSDWGQKLRDGGVRDEAKIAELKKRLEQAYSDVNRFRPADLKTSEVKSALEGLEYFGGDLRTMRSAVGTQPVYEVAAKLTPEFVKAVNDLKLLEAELRTAEAATPGHPLVNTTDQWVNTTLRRALRQAVEANADYIAIPHGDTVLSYNPGDEHGMRGFYGSRSSEGIVPKNLRKLLERMDRSTPAPQKVVDIETPTGKRAFNPEQRGSDFDREEVGFTLFPLTDKVKQSVMMDGQAMFAVSRKLDMSPEVRSDRLDQWRFPAGQTEAGRTYSGMRWHHGANRADRIAEKKGFDAKRASSGPMPFFTSDTEIASNYAKNKPDLSRYDEGNIADYFTVSPRDIGWKGARSPVRVEQSWNFLTPEQRQTIRDRAKRVGHEDYEHATGPYVLHPRGVEATLSGSHYDWLLSHEARGNPLTALRMMWHDGGELVGHEEEMADIWRLAGYPHPISDKTAPWYEAPGVVASYIRMVNPLVTSDTDALQATVIPALEKALKGDRTRRKENGADMWDKNTRWTPKEWVAELKQNLAENKEKDAYVWTSIPDKVTDVLRGLGYDSIVDTGGKGGGERHLVAIPFAPEQVRAVSAAFDPSKAGSGDILAAISDPMRGINAIIRDMAVDLGLTVKQGITTKDAKAAKAKVRKDAKDAALKAGATNAEANKAADEAVAKWAGYYNPRTGVFRTPIFYNTMQSVNMLADLGGAAIEKKLGAELADLIQRAAPGLPSGFQGWFRLFLTNGTAAVAQAPKFTNKEGKPDDLYNAFFDLLQDRDEVLLAKLLSTRDAIETYYKANPTDVAESMVVDSGKASSWDQFQKDRDRFGLRAALMARLSSIYTATIDDLNPVYLGVRDLLRTYTRNTGKKLDLVSALNPYKIMRVEARHANAYASRDMEEGIRPYDGTDPRGPGLVKALALALGSDRSEALKTGAGSRYRKFSTYLVARYAMVEWGRFRDGTKERPPTAMPPGASNANEAIAFFNSVARTYEQQHPEFSQAADMVYDFQRELLTLQRDAGLVSDEKFNELVQDREYVPFLRSFEEEGEDLGSGRVLSGGQRSIFKTKRGSNRDIIDAIASIGQKVFETRQMIAQNDAKRSLMQLAEAAGPGGGVLVERLDPVKLKAMGIDVVTALRQAARENDVSEQDTADFVHMAQQLLGSDATATIFSRQTLMPGNNVLFFWEQGRLQAMQLGGDGQMGARLAQAMYDTINTFGQSHHKQLMGMALLTAPAQMVRMGVTTHPEFFVANIIRDAWMAFLYDPKALPLWSQVKGMVDVARGADYVKGYMRFGSMMGGEATSYADKLRHKRDTRALTERGYRFVDKPSLANAVSHFAELFHARNWADRATGAAIGAVSGASIAGPAGLVAGGVLGGLAGGHLIAKVGEASETATRARLWKHGYDRAIKNGMGPVEAAQEAGFWAHDYTDYARHGSRTETWRSIIPFFNANVQGNDTYLRRLSGKGDQGYNPGLLYPLYKLGLKDVTKLSARERQDMGLSAWTWFMTVFGIGSVSMLLALLYRDDERLKNIDEKMKSTHWLIPIDGDNIRETVILRIPKPFQTVWFAQAIERMLMEQAKDNPRWLENYLFDLWNTWKPPLMPTAPGLLFDMASGINTDTGRAIVPKWKEARLRRDQYDEYTSEFAKWLSRQTDMAPSPFYTDYFIRKLGASWANTALRLNTPGVPWYNPTKPEVGPDEVFIARRFLWAAGKGSDASRVLREMAGGDEPVMGIWQRLSIPYSKLTASAADYKLHIDRVTPDVSGAVDSLQQMTPRERGFAILGGMKGHEDAKLRMLDPINRAAKIGQEIVKLQKEIIDDQQHSGKIGKQIGIDKPKMLPMTPSDKLAARQILTQLNMMEAHNALVLTGEAGWDRRIMFDTSDLKAEFKAALPKLYKEYEARMAKAGVLPWRGTQAAWPAVKAAIEDDKAMEAVRKQRFEGLRAKLIGRHAQAAAMRDKLPSPYAPSGYGEAPPEVPVPAGSGGQSALEPVQ